MPFTTVAGPPALNVSIVSVFHSTPIFFRMRSTISCAVSGAGASAAVEWSAAGATIAPAAARSMNWRREICFIGSLLTWRLPIENDVNRGGRRHRHRVHQESLTIGGNGVLRSFMVEG